MNKNGEIKKVTDWEEVHREKEGWTTPTMATEGELATLRIIAKQGEKLFKGVLVLRIAKDIYKCTFK